MTKEKQFHLVLPHYCMVSSQNFSGRFGHVLTGSKHGQTGAEEKPERRRKQVFLTGQYEQNEYEQNDRLQAILFKPFFFAVAFLSCTNSLRRILVDYKEKDSTSIDNSN